MYDNQSHGSNTSICCICIDTLEIDIPCKICDTCNNYIHKKCYNKLHTNKCPLCTTEYTYDTRIKSIPVVVPIPVQVPEDTWYTIHSNTIITMIMVIFLILMSIIIYISDD